MRVEERGGGCRRLLVVAVRWFGLAALATVDCLEVTGGSSAIDSFVEVALGRGFVVAESGEDGGRGEVEGVEIVC